MTVNSERRNRVLSYLSCRDACGRETSLWRGMRVNREGGFRGVDNSHVCERGEGGQHLIPRLTPWAWLAFGHCILESLSVQRDFTVYCLQEVSVAANYVYFRRATISAAIQQ